MTALIIADDEFVVRRIPKVKADILISCGNIPNDVIYGVAALCMPTQIFAVKGHHDTCTNFPEDITDLHKNTTSFHGVRFGGFCGSWKYKPKGNFLFEQAEVEEALKEFPEVDVFISHNSPRLIHDREDELHYGFVAYTNYITRTKPRLFLHGHQRISAETNLGTTKIIGTYGHRFLVIPD
jgi:Icc-related predicted phosphoesterase